MAYSGDRAEYSDGSEYGGLYDGNRLGKCDEPEHNGGSKCVGGLKHGGRHKSGSRVMCMLDWIR